MERTNRSDVGNSKSPTSREVYSVTQTSSVHYHVTYIARGKYAADQPPIRETLTDNSVMCDGRLSKFFSPRPYSKSVSPISHVTWNQPINDRFLRNSFDDFPGHTNRRELRSSSSDKLPITPPLSLKEPIKYQEFFTSTPTDSSMMCRERLSTFFSPRPYTKSISPITHVSWNQSDRFLSRSFGDNADQTCRVNNSLTKVTKNTHDDYKENETNNPYVLENDDHKVKETHKTEAIETDDHEEKETHMVEVSESDAHKSNETHVAEANEADDHNEKETHMAEVLEADDHKEEETHIAEAMEAYDHNEKETHMAEVLEAGDHKEKKNHIAEAIKADDHNEKETQMAEELEVRAGETENNVVDEHNASGDWEELEKLKKAYEEILKKKEQIDELVERQQLALEEQDRILEDIMQIGRAEHGGMETVAGEYANKMKTYTHFKEETTNRRVYHKEIEIQADILHEENAELAKEISEQVFHINEIEELRHIGLKSLKEKTEEMNSVTEQMKGNNDKLESDIKKKVETLSNLRIELNDLGIAYVSERKPFQDHGVKTKRHLPLIENPLKIKAESLNKHTTDITRKTLNKVIEKVAIANIQKVKKQISGTADYSTRLNECSINEKELFYDMGSVKEHDLNKDIDNSDKNALDMKFRIKGASDKWEVCNEKGSEKVQDLNKDVEDYEKKTHEMKHRIKGSDGKMVLCYDRGSEKVHNLNKDDGAYERTTLEIKHKLGALSSNLDTVLAQEGFVEDREKDDDMNDTKRSECLERQCMGDDHILPKKNDASHEQYLETQGFENNVIEIDSGKSCDEKLKPTKQLSALELVRLPGKRDRKTKIPKPMFHPYGSALRDGDRHVVSKTSSSDVVLRKDYDRKRYVPERQRNAFETVVEYLSAESEIQPPIKYQSPLAHETKRGSSTEIKLKATPTKNKTGTLDKVRNGEIKSKINTGRQNIERRAQDNSQNQIILNVSNDENQRLKKSLKTKPRGKVTEQFKPRNSEIKPKIDTGLNAIKEAQANPLQKKAELSNQNESKSESGVQKDITDTAEQVSHARSRIDRPSKPTVSRKVPKPKQLAPLEIIKKESETGTTVANSCNSEEPLPNIKPARQQVKHKLTGKIINYSDKQERARCPLPPIRRSSATGHDPDYKVNLSISASSCGSMAGTPLSQVTHSVVGKLPVMESDHFTSSTGFADPFIPPSLSPSKRLSPPIATSPTKQKLNAELEVFPLHRKPVLSKSIEHAQQREPAMTLSLFSPTPPQSPPPSSRRQSSRRSRKIRNMPVLASSPTIDPDRKPYLRA